MSTGDNSRCVPIDARLDYIQEQIDNNPGGGGGGVDVYDEGVLVLAGATEIDFIGSIVTVTMASATRVEVDITATAGSQNIFESVAVLAGAGTATGGPCVADTTTDTLTLIAGSFISLSASAGSDAITVAVSGIGSYSSFVVDDINGGSSSGGTASSAVPNASLTLVADTGVTLVRSGNTITIGAPGGGAALTEGLGIDIAGDEISVQIAELTPSIPNRGLFFYSDEGLSVLLHGLYEGGLEFSEDADGFEGHVRDRNRFHLIKGTATSTTTPGHPGIDNVQRVHGEDPVAGVSATEITTSGLDLWCSSGDVVYSKFDDQTDRMTPLLESWSTDTMENLRLILAGLPGYSPSEYMLLGHTSGATTAGQQSIDWKSVAEWLLTLPDLTNPTHVLGKQGTTVGWVAVGTC